VSPSTEGAHPGARLGLPPDGSGSAAPLARRLVAVSVDWLACLAISAAFAPTAGGLWLTRGDPWVTLLVFGAENLLLVGLAGNTLGHRLLGLRVRPVRGAAPVPGLLAGAVRAVLLCLVIPAVVWTGDGRGLHDVAARTVIVRR
jgi:uncharacterized RDD family membrane protein YckC